MLKRFSSGLSILAIVLVAVAGSAAAQTTTCSGTLAPGSYTAVNVPAGATCAVNSGTVTVAGNVTVGKGATFFVAFPNAQLIVNGSLLSMDAMTVEVTANILGSVSLTGTTGSAIITDSFINGSLSVANSAAVGIVVARNQVGGAILNQNNQCFNEASCNSVAANTIGGSLVCAGNSPSPVDTGGSNTVGGSKVGQCTGL
jgi:hypothetical protein